VSKEQIWIFGYGSLMWNPNFEYLNTENGYLIGWNRQFCQASPDHRGTPESPGCVVTLIPQKDSRCYGRLYQISRQEYQRVFAYLDQRECEGYQRLTITVQALDGSSREAVVYIADQHNPHFKQNWTLDTIAKRILVSSGPSGSNLDYFLKLRSCLSQFSPKDEHVEEIANIISATSREGAARLSFKSSI
jgi:glutathione-specific gamma-glutamylcyclotransferase